MWKPSTPRGLCCGRDEARPHSPHIATPPRHASSGKLDASRDISPNSMRHEPGDLSVFQHFRSYTTKHTLDQRIAPKSASHDQVHVITMRLAKQARTGIPGGAWNMQGMRLCAVPAQMCCNCFKPIHRYLVARADDHYSFRANKQRKCVMNSAPGLRCVLPRHQSTGEVAIR